MKIIKYFIQAIFIYAFFIVIKILGMNYGRKLFSFIFKKIGPLIKSKNIINKNIETILGEYDRKAKNSIASNMWSNYGKIFVEYLYLKSFRNKNNHINIEGKEILNDLIKKDEKVIFVSGHFANFELMSMELTKAGINLATIYRPLNNIFINPFMEYLRRKYICKNQITKGISGMRKAVEFLKKNYSIALMIDQRVSEGESLPLFEKKALTTTMPAQLALKYKCNIVPVYITRKENNDFELKIFNPVKVLNHNNTEENKILISLELNKILETMILKNPSQWILTHNRWK